MTNSNAAQVDNQLSLIEDALGKYAAPLPQTQSPDLIREQAVDLLNRADVLESNADELRTELQNREQVVHDIDRQLATLVGLVEEGKVCLRSGEPVRPECAMAHSLIPEVENELSLARNAASAANGQLLAVTNQIDTLRSQYARMIGQVALDARMAHVQALLDTAMQQAAELGLELANNHQFSAAIRVDNRLAILGRNNGMLSSLRNYQGSSR